ncbi:MAG TPA: hypothetical protein VG519_13190 [Pseudochrobactrum sp.]|nr:hypothetical protein [Pseudochrobactrum sp.]
MSFDPSVFYDEGDEVRHRLTGWKGIVVGERNYGAYYAVVFLIDGAPARAEIEPALLRPDNDSDGGDNVIEFPVGGKPKATVH